MITPDYIKLNVELHGRIPAYGTGGHKWAPAVAILARSVAAGSILDYGCGKGTLGTALRAHDVREYDPAVEGKEAPPQPADLVCCLDVLEHVEPECLDAVLADLKRLALRALIVDVSCTVGAKKLADGRPAHVNVRSPDWWESKLRKVFSDWEHVRLPSIPDEFAAVVYR